MYVHTEFVFPPTQDRRFDWEAIDDEDHEPDRPIGYGETEEDAILDLMQQIQLDKH